MRATLLHLLPLPLLLLLLHHLFTIPFPCLLRLRAQFSSESVNFNALHGSASPQEAAKELDFFFPKEQTVAIIKPNALEKKGELVWGEVGL